jgi:hypothetical protein
MPEQVAVEVLPPAAAQEIHGHRQYQVLLRGQLKEGIINLTESGALLNKAS